MDEPAFIHPSSIIVCESELPEYVVFQEIIQSNKLYMRGWQYVYMYILWSSKYLLHVYHYNFAFS